MNWEGRHSGTNWDFALSWHLDAVAASVIHEACVAGDNAVPVDTAETQRIWPVRATILQRHRRSVGGTEQDDACFEDTATQRFPPDFSAGGHRIPTITRMDLCPWAAA